MKEYIDREAAIKSITSDFDEVLSVGEAIDTLDAIPAADVEKVVHGRWVRSGQSFVYPHKFRNYSCSVCGYDIEKTKYNYCPHCGAKMDGGAE